MKTKSIAAALLLPAVMILSSAAVARAQTFSLLHNFTGGSGDGAYPWTGLVRDQAGNLYGTTNVGGTAGLGTVFKVAPDGTETVLHSFDGSDGESPREADLILDAEGNLYGTTLSGGASGEFGGTLFTLDTSGNNFHVLHQFSITEGAAMPFGTLVLDTAGHLYGTTACDTYCSSLSGTVFKLDTNGNNFRVLHTFTGYPADGALPETGLVLDGSTLYGTTYGGGSGDWGTVFKLDTEGGNYSVLYNFQAFNDGAYPNGSLLLDGATLYGTTANGGGDLNKGTVFKLDTNGGNYSLLHSFQETDGTFPQARLILDTAGHLYGTAYGYGGTSGRGTVFRLGTSGSDFTVLHVFQGSPTDGAGPRAGLSRDSAGNLYGTTVGGGASNLGTVFKLAPAVPYSALVQQPIDPDGESVFNAKRGVVPVKFTLMLDEAPTCTLPAATISVQRISNGTSTEIDETMYELKADSGSSFRIDQLNCQYVYNLAASPLGEGLYRVNISIGDTVAGHAEFGLE